MSDRAFPIMLSTEFHLEETRRKHDGLPPFAIRSVPLAMIAPHEKQALANHNQDLETLARRCGLSPCEALAILDDRRWHQMDQHEANAELIKRVAAFA